MSYSIKTSDNKYWIGFNGELLTKKKEERAKFRNKKLAKWYVDNTNVFGSLVVVKNEKTQ